MGAMSEAGENEQFLHLDRYEELGFARLRRFIHDAVERLSDPSVPGNEELPRSEGELYALCDMLQAKADALKDDTPLPECPVYEGPPDPGYYFTPSDELGALYGELERAEERVDYEIEHGGGVYLEYIQGELKKVEQKVDPVERREKEEYQKRLRAYREAHDPFMRRVRSWRAEVRQAEKRREAEANRDELVRRTYQKVKRAFDPKRASGPKSRDILPWELAAPGERTDEHVRGYFREVLHRGQLDGFDQERLDMILALPWSDWSRGTAGFYGYIVLWFDHTEKVLMECPVRDNAIYVLDSGEKRLLQMNKQELIASSEAKRIFHSGDWYQRVKQELGISTSTEQPDD